MSNVIDERPAVEQHVFVRLKRMYLTKDTPNFGKVVQDPKQYEILAGTDVRSLQRIGYVGTQPNAPVNFLRHDIPEHVRDQVLATIAQELGGSDRKTSAPPPLVAEADDE